MRRLFAFALLVMATGCVTSEFIPASPTAAAGGAGAAKASAAAQDDAVDPGQAYLRKYWGLPPTSPESAAPFIYFASEPPWNGRIKGKIRVGGWTACAGSSYESCFGLALTILRQRSQREGCDAVAGIRIEPDDALVGECYVRVAKAAAH